MAAPNAVILNSGGLRSLVATALALQPGENVRASLLFVHDGRDTARLRRDHARRQAETLGIRAFHELELAHLHPQAAAERGEGPGQAPLYAPQLLLAAIAHARRSHAEQVIWPVSVDADFYALSAATEQTALCGHLADLDGTPCPRIDTPLAEFTDRQVVELGAQLGVAWDLAWSCQKRGDAPCRVCAPCRRRAAAFDAAGLVDPLGVSPAAVLR